MLLTDEFWLFSIDWYSKDKVRSSCLSMQNDFNTNVNVLLFCRFINGKQISYDVRQFEKLNEALKISENQLTAFRAERISLKNIDSQLYQSYLNKELEMEKKQQEIIIKTMNSCRQSEVFSNNFDSYLRSRDVKCNETVRRLLSAIDRPNNYQEYSHD